MPERDQVEYEPRSESPPAKGERVVLKNQATLRRINSLRPPGDRASVRTSCAQRRLEPVAIVANPIDPAVPIAVQQIYRRRLLPRSDVRHRGHRRRFRLSGSPLPAEDPGATPRSAIPITAAPATAMRESHESGGNGSPRGRAASRNTNRRESQVPTKGTAKSASWRCRRRRNRRPTGR